MKKLLIAILLIISSAANAEFCDDVVGMSYALMQARQSGIDQKKLISSLNFKDKQLQELFVSIAKDAYKEPKYNTENSKELISLKFADKYKQMCVDAENGK